MVTVGHGKAPVEIRIGEPMGGYRDRTGGVSGVADGLEAHAVTIVQDGLRFIFVVLDVICVNVDLVDAIRERVGDIAPNVLCWVSATHTHAGPETGCVPGGTITDSSIRARLVEAARLAVTEAISTEMLASASGLVMNVEDLANTRSGDPAKRQGIPVDLVEFRDSSGCIVGIWANVPVHPTVLPPSSNEVSADLAGGVRTSIARAARREGNAPWVVVTTGAAGDISTRHTRTSSSKAALALLSERVAQAFARRHMQRRTALWATSDRLPFLRASTELQLEPKSLSDIAQPMSGLTSLHAAQADRTATTLVQGVAIARDLLASDRTASYSANLSVLRMGSALMVGIPGELFLALGSSIAQTAAAVGRFAMVVGYTNGYIGYLPDIEAFGRPSYETYASPVGRGAGESISAAASELVLRLCGISTHAGVTEGGKE